MSELSLNPQLGARIKGIQQSWGFDSPAEVIATIFDSIINKWAIPHPPIAEIVSGALRVKLRTRHVTYFTQISTMTGCSVAEVARSTLIQWLCDANITPMAALPPQTATPTPPKATKSPPKRPKTTPKATESTPIQVETTPETKGKSLLKGMLI